MALSGDRIRRRALAAGWYPRDGAAVRQMCAGWQTAGETSSIAVIVPHAGWAYSGALAFLGLSSLDRSVETIVVVGGHLAAGQPLLLAGERGFETPLGVLESDQEVAQRVAAELSVEPDRGQENSVEVQLGLIAALFPKARIVWLRAPADETAIELGGVLARATSDRRIAVIGSTDLTHFGPRFGITRADTLERNHEWVRTVNDRGFLDCCVAGDASALLAHAARHQSACSPGAAAAAVTFARAGGALHGRQLGYDTSFRIARDESFVGYGVVAFSP